MNHLKLKEKILDEAKRIGDQFKIKHRMLVGGDCEIILSRERGRTHGKTLKPDERMILSIPVSIDRMKVGEVTLTYHNDPKKGLVKTDWVFEQDKDIGIVTPQKKGLSWLKRRYEK